MNDLHVGIKLGSLAVLPTTYTEIIPITHIFH